MKNSIVAYDKNRTIGNEGGMPWEGQLPADMRHFRELTVGKSIIMGRKTLESIGRPLPKRQNIVVSRMGFLAMEGIIVANSLEEAYSLANEEIFVIGGGAVYQASLPDMDTIYATEIDASLDGDTHFPVLDALRWQETQRQTYLADEVNAFDYSFVTYSKKSDSKE